MISSKRARHQKITIPVGDDKVTLYAGKKVLDALSDVTLDMNLYKGVKLEQVLEAVYKQGKKDGAREAFQSVHHGIEAAQKAIPHRNPGAPAKKKKPARRKK